MTALLVAALALLSPLNSGGFAPNQGQKAGEDPHRLPIDVPKDATVNFEVDAPGAELMTVIKQFLLADGNDLPGANDPYVVKTPLGDLKIQPSDVEALLRQIRELHVVSYSGSKVHDPVQRYARDLAADGMHKVGHYDGPPEVLVLERRRSRGQYAVVVRRKDNITVVRTDGAPDLGDLTKTIVEIVARSTQDAIVGKKKAKPAPKKLSPPPHD